MDLGKRCLLVVEDDPDLHLLFARVAEREGFRVESAHSGDQALLTLNPDASVIYVSGVEADQARRGPNTLYLEKPVHILNLTAALRRIR